ncbi:MAG: ATP-binding cassette domain-containing protein [Actinomycetia bacterium]|nr:ATP-binding cassette domain-containing protein [Actinomycetes bacterium]
MKPSLRTESLTLTRQGRGQGRGGGFHLEVPPLEVANGEILTVMGHSGSGKSTLLMTLVGLVDDELTVKGRMWLADKEITHLASHERNIGIVFQQDFLFPHMTVGENLRFALNGRRVRKAKGAEARQSIADALVACELPGVEDRYPDALSGGQRARIAVMRCLLSAPRAVVMDEPFSGLDVPLRERFRQFVFGQLISAQIPAILVTHDEADRIENGRVICL